MNMPCVSIGPCPTPECTRWTQINSNEPIRIFHDDLEWDPNYYANINNPDANVYLLAAMQVWNDAYSCGDLFELVTDPAQQQVRVRYIPEPSPTNAIATATCFCDDEDDVCIEQVDHSAWFSAANPGTVTMYCSDIVQAGLSENQWIRVYIHELGHILGMGHVYGLPVFSVMGIADDGGEIPKVFPWDVKEMVRRYPCCDEDDTGVVVPPTFNTTTATFCPGCLASAYT